MRKKNFDKWCNENEDIITDIYNTVQQFLDDDITYHHPIRTIKVDHERLKHIILMYLYKTSNNAFL